MTYKEAFDYGQRELEKAGQTDAANDAFLLLEHVTGVSRKFYFLKMQEELAKEDWQRYQEYIKKRKSHIPLQHITGVQNFMGIDFCVNEHVLIPRQDTETLVEEALKVLKKDMTVLDMCTGSGCIIISLAKLREIKGTGVDLSERALSLAKENALRQEVNVDWIQGDLFSRVTQTYDMIISNPPYIKTDVIESLQKEVKCFDPYMALDGKEDGLYFYRKIIKESPKFLNQNGKLYFEIGHDQGKDVKEMMQDAGFTGVTVKKDLAGLDRVVFGAYNELD